MTGLLSAAPLDTLHILQNPFQRERALHCVSHHHRFVQVFLSLSLSLYIELRYYSITNLCLAHRDFGMVSPKDFFSKPGQFPRVLNIVLETDSLSS